MHTRPIRSRRNPSLGSRLAVWLATGLGIGLAAPAPGTVAGLWGLLLVPLVARLPTLGWQLAAAGILIVVAAIVCDLAAEALGTDADPQSIALDEIAVLPIVFLGVNGLTWQILLVGYLLFRLFDVWKPQPAPLLEKLPGGAGIVADDAAAAAFAWLALQGLLWADRAAETGWLAA